MFGVSGLGSWDKRLSQQFHVGVGWLVVSQVGHRGGLEVRRPDLEILSVGIFTTVVWVFHLQRAGRASLGLRPDRPGKAAFEVV